MVSKSTPRSWNRRRDPGIDLDPGSLSLAAIATRAQALRRRDRIDQAKIIVDKQTYLRLRDAAPGTWNHEADAYNSKRRVRVPAGTRRVWMLSGGLHLLGVYPARGIVSTTSNRGMRRMDPSLKSYRHQIAEAFHDLARRAVRDGVLEDTVLLWRATNFICIRGQYGAWRAAAEGRAAELRTPRGQGAALCAAEEREAWRREAAPAWGGIGLAEACDRATMSPDGGEYLNELAAETLRLLNRCYLDPERGGDDLGALGAGFPCPSDLRGLATRTSWRLPGVFFVGGNHLGRALCGRTSGDGVHSPQIFVPLTRMLLAAIR